MKEYIEVSVDDLLDIIQNDIKRGVYTSNLKEIKILIPKKILK